MFAHNKCNAADVRTAGLPGTSPSSLNRSAPSLGKICSVCGTSIVTQKHRQTLVINQTWVARLCRSWLSSEKSGPNFPLEHQSKKIKKIKKSRCNNDHNYYPFSVLTIFWMKLCMCVLYDNIGLRLLAHKR